VASAELEREAVQFCRSLIQIDTSNFGGPAGANEGRAAQYVADRLSALKLAYEVFEPAPGRVTLACHIRGSRQDLPGLVVHAHLDTVPVNESDWTVDPFGGLLRDGLLWGRGAVDMKNVCAMMLAVARNFATDSMVPRRNILLIWFADEEAGSEWGAKALLKARPEVLDGYGTAISEVGGFSVDLADGTRGYLIETEQKGAKWLRLTAQSDGGHGALVHDHPAPATLVKAIAAVLDISWDKTPLHPRAAELATRGELAAWVNAAERTTCNVTQLSAVGSGNVIAASATADIDCRVLDLDYPTVVERIREATGGLAVVSILRDELPTSSTLTSEFEDAVLPILRRHDPNASLIPFRMPIGSDNRILRAHGVASYGFIPMRLPPDYAFARMFHGPDERIPLTTIAFAVKALRDLILDF
jgi:acetylornithine deacetylase/succinyl-diaminopimelate desuccinylase-like protein